MEKQQIKELIEVGYLNGALNEMLTEKMKEVYHPDFAIFFKEKEAMNKLPLNDWVEMVEEFKATQTDYRLRQFTYEFLEIDVTETAAIVKLNLSRQGQLIFTDYITLLKFDNGWKIVTKIYHAHVDNPWQF